MTSKMQFGNLLDLEPTAMSFDKQFGGFGSTDMGFCSGSACSSPEHTSSCPATSPAHSNTESVDSAFEDFLESSLYDSRVSSPQDDFLKPGADCKSVFESFQADTDLDWMSMPMPLDFDFKQDDIAELQNSCQSVKSEPFPYNNVEQVKPQSSPEIDFRNLEIVLKEKAKEKMREEQMLKCSQEEMKLLQNVMLYKQQPQQGVMFQEPLNLPTPPQQQPQRQQQQQQSYSVLSRQQDPPSYSQFDCQPDSTLDNILPTAFLVKSCENLIKFINNEDTKFLDNIPITPTEAIAYPFSKQIPSFKQTSNMDSKPKLPRASNTITLTKPKIVTAPLARSTNKPRLYNFLVELLKNPDRYSCIEWVNREEGIFKFLDSAEVARLWGHRKNKPNMKYENFARSLRTYIAKGILTKPRNKLVYKFVKSVV